MGSKSGGRGDVMLLVARAVVVLSTVEDEEGAQIPILIDLA